MDKRSYDFKAIEKKWAKAWEEKKIFNVKENAKKKKFYVLDMFPYPSGEGLHMGHAFVFSLGDIFARFKRMQGFNVLYPIGYDALGLPAENAAIKKGIHPEKYTNDSIANFMKQQKAMGWSYDWDRLVKTSDPEFYKWDQWIFLQMLKKGLAYRKKSAVNFCPKCDTVLANEQVIGGKCWRHEDTNVEIKQLEQWYFKTTAYAEELLQGLNSLDWPERAKLMQRNWIGKSEGSEILFEINGEKWPIFTTRPDTIYGVTFMVISCQHPRLFELVTDKQKPEVEKFLKKLGSVSEKELEIMDKEGVFTGSYAINPMSKERIPIYAGNFVVADYGSGMVMAVPGHDSRDFDFAKKYKLPIKEVIDGGRPDKEAYSGSGKLINSGEFNGLDSEEAKEHIVKALELKKLGKKAVNYKLRDWLISRQRYWGTPIPIVYCDKCGVVSVPEKKLPVKLPKDVKFGKGNPLATNEKWINTKCPKCGKIGRRETDTMDTFVNSSWYYLRYTDAKNKKQSFNPKKANYWCPVDQYIGGPEHITMHLIYIRFYAKFLRDLGLLEFSEPALKYFTQGVVKGSDGNRMSKSRGNVVEPLETINKYGADSLRLYLMSVSAPESDFNWDEKGIEGSFRFLSKVYEYFSSFKPGKIDARIESKLNLTIKEVTSLVEGFKHNLAVIHLRNFFDYIQGKEIDGKTAQNFLQLLHIYCPFITEELWQKFKGKGFISLSSWPKTDEKKINLRFEKEEEVIDGVISDINNVFKIIKDKGNNVIRVYLYVLPNEVKTYLDNMGEIEKRTSLEVKIFAVNDPKKKDPENKSKKAKPNRPAIYLE
jgi:leucyl-tRNA synthetase